MITEIVQTEEALRACLVIRRAVFVEEQKVPEDEEIDAWDRLPAEGEATPVHILVRADDGTPVATARLIPYMDRAAKIQRVAVAAAYRKAGYGSAVMAAAESAALRRGFARAVLDAQLQAEGFYRRLGYRRVSDEVFLDAGIPHVRMEKGLAAREIDRMLEANRAYAETFDKGSLPAPPSRRVAVLTCMDARIDPLQILGAHIGEIHVIRNAGGRVTEDAIRSLAISQQWLGTREVLVLQHTRCGMHGLTDQAAREKLAGVLGPEAGAAAAGISFYGFADVAESVRKDVERLRQSPLIAPEVYIAGAVYDVETGRVIPVEEYTGAARR
jgi:carbonic anhydrase